MIEDVLELMNTSAHHRTYTVDTILRCIQPPLHLGQFAYIVEDDCLVAWATWAWLPSNKAEAFLNDAYKLRADDWCTGENLVFMDFIAPYGHALKLYGLLREIFKDIPPSELPGARWVRFAKQGKKVSVKNGK